jgi:hypothetical protein
MQERDADFLNIAGNTTRAASLSKEVARCFWVSPADSPAGGLT